MTFHAHLFNHHSNQQSDEVVILITLNLQMRKPKHEIGSKLPQGHLGRRCTGVQQMPQGLKCAA